MRDHTTKIKLQMHKMITMRKGRGMVCLVFPLIRVFFCLSREADLFTIVILFLQPSVLHCGPGDLFVSLHVGVRWVFWL